MATYNATMINGLLLPDGWHVVAGGLALDWDVSIQDSTTGTTATPSGGPWIHWTEADGTLLIVPLDRVQAIRHAPA